MFKNKLAIFKRLFFVPLMSFLGIFLAPNDNSLSCLHNSLNAVWALRSVSSSNQLIKMNSKILMIRVEDICILDHQVWKSMPILSLIIKSRCKAKTCLIDLSRVLSKALIKLNQIGNCLSHQVLSSYLMRVLQDQGKNDTGRLFSFFDKLRSAILNNLKTNQG